MLWLLINWSLQLKCHNPEFLTILAVAIYFPFAVNSEMHEQRVKSVAAVTDLTPPPAEKLVVERVAKSGSLNKIKSPISAATYTVASLQTATNSFSQEFLIGEGSLGRVYRAEFSNGKVIYQAVSCVKSIIFLCPINHNG